MIDIRKDNFEATVTEKEELLDILREMEADEEIISIPGNQVTIMRTEDLSPDNQYAYRDIDEALIKDTAINSGIMLDVAGRMMCLRNTGLPGLLQSACGITGAGINRLMKHKPELFCDTMNRFMESCKDPIKLRYSCGKVSGIFSKNYQEIPISHLVNETTEALSDKLGEPVIKNGMVSHRLTAVTWALPPMTESELIKSYKETVGDDSELYSAEYRPRILFSSSSTGAGAVKLRPQLYAGQSSFFIGPGINIRHTGAKTTGGRTFDQYKKQVKEVFSLYKQGFDNLARMASCEIHNPQNAFIAACNWAFKERLPRKLASRALDTFMELGVDDAYVSAYDIYIAITDITLLAQKAKFSFERQLELHEMIGRLVGPNWNMFDVSGVVAWRGGEKDVF